MAARNCSSSSNNSEVPTDACADNINDKVSLSPADKIAAFSIVYGVIFLVSVVGNALVCIVIIKRKDMRTVTNLFLFNMALSDLLSTVFTIPPILAIEISPQYWPLGDFMCRATPVINTISVSVSINTMVALALERYQAIVNPFMVRASRHSHKKALVVMFVIWLVSCAIATPQALVVTTIDDPPFRYCGEDWSGNGGVMGNRIYTVVAFVILFVIPLMVICVSYAIIMRKLWQPEHVLSDQYKSPPPDNEGHGSPHKVTMYRAKRKRKTTYMLLTVIIVFLICMLPFQIMILVSTFINLPRLEAYTVLKNIFSVLAVCSMACNPFVYSFFSEKFRRAFTDVFKCRCEDDIEQTGTQMSSVVLLSSTRVRK